MSGPPSSVAGVFMPSDFEAPNRNSAREIGSIVQVTPVAVFISYSHRDEKFRAVLETHLALLKRNGVVTVWHDRKIMAGQPSSPWSLGAVAATALLMFAAAVGLFVL